MIDYKYSGVDQEKTKLSLNKLKARIEKTHQNNKFGTIVEGIGGFSGIFRPKFHTEDYDFVATTDGVGTKIELCSRFSFYEPLGYDLVAMCVNDLYCSGAQPAFFLDYISCGKLNDDWYIPVVSNIAQACKITGMALLGGETAEHPGIMQKDEFDLAGFCVGFCKRKLQIPRKDKICHGDILLALSSSGLHSNGFSLVRMILKEISQSNKVEYNKLVQNEEWIKKDLLTPTKIYHEIPHLTKEIDIKGIAHITGGGIYENLPRILPKHLLAIIENKNTFPLKIYDWLRQFVTEKELFKTFNMGYGMILIMSESEAKKAVKQSHLKIMPIGRIENKKDSQNKNIIIDGL